MKRYSWVFRGGEQHLISAQSHPCPPNIFIWFGGKEDCVLFRTHSDTSSIKTQTIVIHNGSSPESKSIASGLSAPSWLRTKEPDNSSSGYHQTNFPSYIQDDNKVAGHRPVDTKQAINPTITLQSWTDCGVSWFPYPFWQQSLLEGKQGTSGGSRQGLVLHDGRTSAWKLHYVPAVGLAVTLSKETASAGWCSWQVCCRLFEAKTLFMWHFLRGEQGGSYGYFHFPSPNPHLMPSDKMQKWNSPSALFKNITL